MVSLEPFQQRTVGSVLGIKETGFGSSNGIRDPPVIRTPARTRKGSFPGKEHIHDSRGQFQRLEFAGPLLVRGCKDDPRSILAPARISKVLLVERKGLFYFPIWRDDDKGFSSGAAMHKHELLPVWAPGGSLVA